MTLSGRISNDIASNYTLSIEWSASQNDVNNSSTITAKMYWQADKYGYINSSTVKDGAIVIDGTTYTFSGSGLADLNPGQKKLIATKSKTVYHNSEGDKSFSISGYFDVDVRISGTYYGRVSTGSRSYDLDTIPRKSSLSSSVNFTAGGNFTLTVARSSSSFNHIAYIDVQNKDGSWQYVKSVSFSTSETSKSSDFDTTSYTRIFTALDGRASAPVRVNLNTYSGSTNLGYNTKTGTVTAPQATIGEGTYGQAGDANKWYVDQLTGVSITRYNPTFTHTVEITAGSFKKTLTDITTGATWQPNSTEQAALYSAIGTNKSYVTGNMRTYTYYNGVQVRSAVDRPIYFYVRPENNAPIFVGTGITYADTNSKTVAITGDNKTVIQNNSTLVVTIPSGSVATGQNGATISKYVATVDGISKTVSAGSGSVTIDFGTVNIAADKIMTIRATDTRGLSTTATLSVKFVPYTPPKIVAVVRRNNNFEVTININTNGTIAPISVGGAQKNSLAALPSTTSALQYRYREQVTGAQFGDWKNLAYTASNASYTGTLTTETLDSTKAYVFEVRVSDKLSTTIASKVVTSGRPMLYIDPIKNSIGIGMFPLTEKALYTQGEIHVGNPTDNTQEIFLGFLNGQPRIRSGGNTRGIQLQGTGDKLLFGLDNSANGTLPGTLKLGASADVLSAANGKLNFNGKEIGVKGQYEIPPTRPSMANGYSRYFDLAYFKTMDGTVFLRGMMQGQTSSNYGLPAFQLPAGCRPTNVNQVFYVTTQGGGRRRADLKTDGTFTIHESDGAAFDQFWCLNGIYFSVLDSVSAAT
ncbi:tail protein [Bacillus phage Moonbeam]|uniref:Structural protein n=1 Tax=Bacillus phage Moonbeam TaxID=1540091 RepID=A0A0A0RPE7_9CAUD|nr:tail protein [Bacillus phage Moonbeam]AIW03474.1 structural protein [Bacillus phage Moonbeam]